MIIDIEKIKAENTSFLHCSTDLYSPGLLDWASIGIMSLARVARRAASDLSRVDIELPASSVSWPKEKQYSWGTCLLQWYEATSHIISTGAPMSFSFVNVLNNNKNTYFFVTQSIYPHYTNINKMYYNFIIQKILFIFCYT